MAESKMPHFHNDAGVSTIKTGSKSFMCTGATPPFDHPHIFLDMGSSDETICPYCSTRYEYSPALPPGGAEPASCVYGPEKTV